MGLAPAGCRFTHLHAVSQQLLPAAETFTRLKTYINLEEHKVILMVPFTNWTRRPVKREGADRYLLLTLLSFAGSVTFTRLFLELTGYPQIGGETYHIAHVLWGGLLLFFASLLPLVAANRWVFTVSALLSGIGVGLFIDEVGKFITQNNDYFHPLAAPIVYALFLFTVLIYIRVRRPPSRDLRAELYRAFDTMEEVLEHDLDPNERDALLSRLRYVAEEADLAGQQDFARLAHDLMDFVQCESITLASIPSTPWRRFQARWRRFEEAHISKGRLSAVLAGGMLGLGLLAVGRLLLALPLAAYSLSLGVDVGSLAWLATRFGLEAIVGVLLLVAVWLLLARREGMAINLGAIGLLLSLTAVNLLVFYFDQFSAILTAFTQFWILAGLFYYRQRFLASAAG